jgi:hypothetical protein
MTQATASDEAVLMFAGPSEWEQEARERLYPLGCVTESPYQLAPGETLLLLRAFVRDGHGRATRPAYWAASLAGNREAASSNPRLPRTGGARNDLSNVRRAGSPASLDPRAALFLSRAGSGPRRRRGTTSAASPLGPHSTKTYNKEA